MNLLAILSVLALVIGTTFVAYSNFDLGSMTFLENPAVTFHPPYAFQAGDWVSTLNAFFFVFLFSMLFFGLSAPIAMGLEGAKFGSLLSTGTVHAYDYVFVIPQLLGAYAAILLGQGVLRDFGGKETVFVNWGGAFKFFAAGLLLTVVLIALRSMVVN
ncbi:hypothetical protein KJ765_05125 [Candidatus Micrarchaeota archaeon]|nr:hypothetical protein [Candidatus Micrarchaeota archaeon]